MMTDKDWVRKQVRESLKFYQLGKLSKNQLVAIVSEAIMLESQYKLSSKTDSMLSKLDRKRNRYD